MVGKLNPIPCHYRNLVRTMSGGAKTTSKAAGLNVLAKIDWKKLPCPIEELRLDITLKCGQSFRWKSLDNKDDGPDKDVDSNKVFIGVVRKRYYQDLSSATLFFFVPHNLVPYISLGRVFGNDIRWWYCSLYYT